MKWICLILLALVGVAVADDLPLAEACDSEACQLPDCRCSSTEIPGGLNARDVPMFVIPTFDDAVNVLNIETYREVLYDRTNFNGCPIGTTFYVNHEYTNYRLVNELYNRGFEIGLHSISHRNEQDYWRYPTYEAMWEEFVEQRIQMSHFANIPSDSLKGIRKPFLELGGNITYKVMADGDLLYDCSWTTISYLNPGLWPYTLDHASIQDCQIGACPTASIPKVWILPMLGLLDPTGVVCGMADQCPSFQGAFTAEEWRNFLLENFERQYLGNRAPFGFYIHEWYFTAFPNAKEGFKMFLDVVTQLSDVFVTNSNEVIEWVRNPVTVDVYRQRACKTVVRTLCQEFTCAPLQYEDRTYWMQHCNTCPNNYPWLGNPLGE